MMKMKVIDVSEFQGTIDWESVKSQIDGAILRTGYGGDYPGQQDATFERNAKECARLGIPFGVYHYSYADSREKAVNEANHILRLIKPYKLSFSVYLDLEEEKDSIRSFAKESCIIIGDIIEKAGYWFGVYANLNWWENYLTSSELNRFTKWVAQYNDVCQYTGHDMWQYTSSGKVSGISGSVDMNECYRDFPKEIRGETEKPVQPSFQAYQAKVIALSGLNIRSGAGTSYPAKGAYRYGEIVRITGESGGWGKTDKGWISLEYTTKNFSAFKPYQVVVTADSGLNVRTGPGTGYGVSKALPKGTQVTVTDERSGWGKISGGWVSLDYLKKESGFKSYKAKVTASSGLNGRSGPGINYGLKGGYSFGSTLTIVQELDGWGKTSSGTWVSLEYIKKI